MKATYALLVGINEYPPPITALGGCIRDLDQVEGFLQEMAGSDSLSVEELDGLPVRQCGPIHICRLDDRMATYNNIMLGFRRFLRRASAGDVVWFHFSGHGSEAFTAEEFLEIEPNGKDQTLVCYYATPEDGQLHLADKELAVLLHEVATQDEAGRPKECPHIVVSLDCCHSGSGTRDVQHEHTLRTRNYNALRATSREKAQGIRRLDTYAGGYYAGQWKQQKALEVPVAPHVLISACESVQKAGDQPSGGLLTTGLLEALRGARGNINYADLFVRTRSTVQRAAQKYGLEQMPQFETIGNFDPYTRFLDGSSLGTPYRYEVFYENGQWMARCGALHGIPLKPARPVEMDIQSLAPYNEVLGGAVLEAIGAHKSRLKVDEGLVLDTRRGYQGTIRSLPAPPVLVLLRGERTALEKLKQAWDVSRNIQWVEEEQVPETGAPPLEVEAAHGQYIIYDRKNGRQALETSQSPKACRIIVDALGKIVNWERTLKLRHSHSAIQEWISLELEVMDKDRQRKVYTEDELVLNASPETFMQKDGALFAGFIPRARVSGGNQNLYCYLLHLRSNYSIESYEGEVVFRPGEHEGKSDIVLPMWKAAKGWGLSPGEEEAVSYFLLLAGTESLDYHQLLQSGLGSSRRDVEFEWNPLAVFDDWCSKLMKVRLARQA